MKVKPIIISSLIILILAFFLSKVITHQAQPEILIGTIIGVLALAISFFSPTAGITILIFSMLLSPEVKVGEVPARAISIRYDDILLISITLGLLAKNAILKPETTIIPRTPLNRPIIIYILIFLISTLKGIIGGYVNPIKSFFYVLKYFEYFLLFFIVADNIKSEKQVKIFLIAGLITCIIVSIYGYVQISKGVIRVGAPFDIEGIEPASFGGYLLLIFGVLTGLLIYAKTIPRRIFFAALIVFIIPPFLHTLSRASYIGFIVMLLGFIIFARRMKLTILILLIFGILLYPMILPTAVISRLQETFTGPKSYSILSVKTQFDLSSIERLESYVRVINEKLPEHFFIGYGVTGAGFIDSQYFLTLAEVGTIGFITFIWLIIKIFKSINKVYRNLPIDYWAKGLPLGFLTSLAGLLAQAITTNSFIIVRIMEPFWFLCAVILTLPNFRPKYEKKN